MFLLLVLEKKNGTCTYFVRGKKSSGDKCEHHEIYLVLGAHDDKFTNTRTIWLFSISFYLNLIDGEKRKKRKNWWTQKNEKNHKNGNPNFSTTISE